MSFQTHKTFVHLRDTNSDILDEIWELSDPAYTATQLKRSLYFTLNCSKVSFLHCCHMKRYTKMWGAYSLLQVFLLITQTVIDCGNAKSVNIRIVFKCNMLKWAAQGKGWDGLRLLVLITRILLSVNHFSTNSSDFSSGFAQLTKNF